MASAEVVLQRHGTATATASAGGEELSQLEADEAFARRLQAQEMGFSMPTHNRRANTGGGGGGGGGGAGGGGIRMNIANNVLQNQVVARPSGRGTMLVTTIVTVPQVAIGTYVMLVLWDPDVACDKPLAFWCIGSILRLALVCMSAWGVYWSQGAPERRHSAVARWSQCVRYPLDIMGLLWFVIGNVWLLTTQDCSMLMVSVYRLSVGFLIVQYILLLAPCLLVLLLIPIICLCLPCFLRMARHANPLGTRGVSRDRLQQLRGEKFSTATWDKEQEASCCICLSEYEDGDEVRHLPCGGSHHFHKDCIDEWLQLNATCPQCRDAIFDANGNVIEHASTNKAADDSTAAAAQAAPAGVASQAADGATTPTPGPPAAGAGAGAGTSGPDLPSAPSARSVRDVDVSHTSAPNRGDAVLTPSTHIASTTAAPGDKARPGSGDSIDSALSGRSAMALLETASLPSAVNQDSD